jgi:hypothetical protein
MAADALFDPGTGEVIPNIATTPFAVIFESTRKYPKVQAAVIVITAVDAAAAREYASSWLRMPHTVITAVVEVRTGGRPAFDAVGAIAARPEPELNR